MSALLIFPLGRFLNIRRNFRLWWAGVRESAASQTIPDRK